MLALTCGLCPPVSSRVLSSSDQAGASSSGVPSAGPHSDPAAAVHPRRADWWAVHRYVSTEYRTHPASPRLCLCSCLCFAWCCLAISTACRLRVVCLHMHTYDSSNGLTHSPLASVWSDDVCDTNINTGRRRNSRLLPPPTEPPKR